MHELKITAWGHPNILAEHQTTWQLTTEDHVTKRGDCIIGINASSSCKSLPGWLKDHLRAGGEIEIRISTPSNNYKGKARGHEELDLVDNTDMVFRRSNYTCGRTAAIGCTFTARDLPRTMIEELQKRETKLEVMISV